MKFERRIPIIWTLITLIALPLLGLIHPLGEWLPSHLVGALDGLVRKEGAADFIGAAAVTVISSAGLLAAGIRGIAAREL